MKHIASRSARVACLVFLMLAVRAPAPARAQPRAEPPAAAAEAIQRAIADGVTPGAVLLWGTADGPPRVYAAGKVSSLDDAADATPDTIYDVASLTKTIATATAVLILVDRGEVELGQPVATYLPAFGNHGKEGITVEQLLTHHSGLTPDTPMSDYPNGRGEAIARMMRITPRTPPGTAYAYSDVNFQVLGELVEAVDGRPLDAFAREEIFEPLKMVDTGFLPAGSLRGRIASTTKRDGEWLQGEVHDPRAFATGGVAGHAGLFATALDIGRWVRMLLNGGELDGRRILSDEAVRRMLTPRALPDGTGVRGLGVDIDSPYAPVPRGDRFPVGSSFGHTGYTGTAYWADPASGAFYVLLTNRVHPDDKSSVTPLRRAVATAVALDLLGPAEAEPPAGMPVLNGIDVLRRDGFRQLTGKRIAVATNHTGVTLDGTRLVDLLAAAPGVDLVRIFSPEHGLYGNVDTEVGDTRDPATAKPVFSLYGKTRKPSAEMMEGLDAVVFDIQDIGVRYYTYPATMGLLMQAAAEHGVGVIVLDRPNPLNGRDVQGPVTDPDKQGFTSFGQTSLRHGMTMGELALFYNRELGIGADVTVVPCEGWTRDRWYDRTGLRWINPSPNMRNLPQAALYPAVGLIESGRQISVGRGTDQPFELFGAPWIDDRALAAELNSAAIAGLRFVPVTFTPTERHFEARLCRGVYVLVTDREALDPVVAGLRIAWTLEHLFPDDYRLGAVNDLIRNDAVMQALESDTWPADVAGVWQDGLEAFKARRAEYLLYE